VKENVFSIEYIIENGFDKSAYGFIYITTYKDNGMKYIGQKKFRKGWKYYLGSGTHLKNAIKLYGKDNFSRGIISVAYSKEELNLLEIHFIKTHNAVESENYYNILHGGEGGSVLGIKRSDEFKEKLHKANIGKKLSQDHILKLKNIKGEKHWAYGTKRPPELVRQLSMSRRGNGNPMFGKQLSKDHKRKIGEAQRGNKNHFYGKQLSEEHKNKIRSSNSKLDIIQISKIKQMLLDNYKLKFIAELFNISISLISEIKTNKKWSDIHPLLTNLEYNKHNIKGSSHRKSKLTENDVIKIKNMLNENIKQNDIAKLFSVSKYAISDIKRGKSWSYIHIMTKK